MDALLLVARIICVADGGLCCAVGWLVGWPKARLSFLYKWALSFSKQILYPHLPYFFSSIPYSAFEVERS